MKILLAAPFDRPWYTGYYLMDAMHSLMIGYSCFDYREKAAEVGVVNMNASFIKIIEDYSPDLVLVLKGELIQADLIRSLSIPTALWYLDYESPIPPQLLQQAAAYKFFFTVCKGQVEEFKGANSHWLPEAYCDVRFKPVDVEPLPKPVADLTAFRHYGSDVAFIGTDKDRPVEVLQRIAEEGYDRKLPINCSMKIWGAQVSDGWKKGHLERYWMGYRTTDEEFNKICASSKILLGVSTRQKKNCSLCFSARVYQTLGARGFLLEESSRDLEEIFTDQKDLALWDSEDDLISKIKHYLEKDEKRRSIAEQGYQNVRKNHTFKQRMETLLTMVGLWK